MSDDGPPMGSICHHEIPSPDLDAQTVFYGKLFGWTFEPMRPDYLLFRDGLSGGGLDAKAQPSENGVVCVVTVPEVTTALAEIREAGGEALTEKAPCGDSPDFGYYAYFRDPCGNRLGIWSRN